LIPFPDKKYNIVYADPPWQYDNEKVCRPLGRTLRRSEYGAAKRYSLMSLEEIKSLPVSSICSNDAVLFLWATVPLLPEALEVLKSWGFRYKTLLTWRKIMSQGMGYWFSGQTEHLLLGIKGKVKAFRSPRPNFIQCSIWNLKHSQKPYQFRRLIETATAKTFPETRRIELFARQRAIGWDAWGLEVPAEIRPLELFQLPS
jgi:N6-adenosine-specific RNA methylase IME4